MRDAVLLLSGGIDSTTLLYRLRKKYLINVHCLIFDYGQSLIKEVKVAINNAQRLKCKYEVIKIDLGFANSKCSLISDTNIDTNRTFEEIDAKVPTSYVEFRNGIFLSYAVMYAEVNDISNIYGGFNGLNSGKYYDDTHDFIKSFQRTANIGTNPFYQVEIHAPYSGIQKWEIVSEGMELGLFYHRNTWSCYKSGTIHCGVCDSCKQRDYALGRAKTNQTIQDK